MKRNHWTSLLASSGLVLGLAAVAPGCNQSDFDDIRGEMADEDEDGDPDDDDSAGDEGPGSGARDDDNVGCEIEDDCGNGETCVEGVCQMQRCQDGPYNSAPPSSASIKFFLDQEFVVADSVASDGDFFVDGYAPEVGSIEYPGSWNMGSTAVVDVVGGDEFGAVLDTVRPGGKLVTAGAIAGPVVELDIRRLYLGQRTLIGSTMHTPADFADLAAIARAGTIAPIVAETYPLTEIAAAQERFVAKDFVGKLVLLP